MEKAKLIIKETKKKKLIAELHLLETNKTMPFPQFKPQDTSMNGAEVEVERKEGKIAQVKAGDQTIYEIKISSSPVSHKPHYDDRRRLPQRTSRYQDARSSKQTSNVRYPAHAPYNFIPLNETVVEAEKIPGQDFPLNAYHRSRHTGWIDIEIETQTPLYIRDTLTSEEDASDKVKSDFFSPSGQPQIPGSSLRGMIRTLVEIVSFGKFGAYTDRRFYFRGLADKSNLRKEYQERMSSFDRKSRRAIYKMSAGLLRKRGKFDYEIVPAERFWQIAKPKAQGIVKTLNKFTNQSFEYLKSEGIPQNVLEPLKCLENKKFPDKEKFLAAVKEQIGEEQTVRWKKPILDHTKEKYGEFNFYETKEGYLVVSGNMQNKKKDWMIAFPAPNAKAFPIPEDDIKDYKDDATRADTVPNLVDLVNREQHKKGVPCFYVKWQDRFGRSRVSFGHTAMFRLAYEKTVGEHIPEPHHDDEKIDLAEAIFGNETTFAGRVFFEDAKLNPGQTDVLMGEDTPKILSSPKPTTFQHYLTQSSDDIRQLNHYNTNTPIRGNKLYWHKSGEHWQETDQKNIKDHPKQYTKINPVKPHTKFTGRIRFENLSDAELGALLFSLDLPKGCFHKLGMGKPLGLGSIKVTPTLHISKRKERYTELFFEWEHEIEESNEIEKYKTAFENYVLSQIEKQGKLWETDRLQELRVMLDYEKGVELEKRRRNEYMTITPENEFKDRPVLPMPTTTADGRK